MQSKDILVIGSTLMLDHNILIAYAAADELLRLREQDRLAQAAMQAQKEAEEAKSQATLRTFVASIERRNHTRLH
jgi:hypothetical protein